MKNFSDLSGRIQRGDRDALAALIVENKSRIERRVRGKIRAAGVTAFDAEDVFSSCARRLDLMCIDRRLRNMSEDELMRYICRVAMNVATDRIRAEQRRRRTLDRLWRESFAHPGGSPAEPDQPMIDWLLSQLREADRIHLELRLSGLAHVEIASKLGIAAFTERKRWHRLRSRAKAIIAAPDRLIDARAMLTRLRLA